MRLAFVSDIHANLTALEAVTVDLRKVSPDLVIHGGDLVGSGARPAEVVDRIRELGWPIASPLARCRAPNGVLDARGPAR